jgi:hypothetical protein
MLEKSRFDALYVNRLAMVNESRRFEMQFADSDGRKVLVSLPVQVAVELGCRICDLSERAPYLVGGVRISRASPARSS